MVYLHKTGNVAVIVLNPVTIKIFPGAEFPGARGVLIA